MAVEIKFTGSYFFQDEHSLNKALSEVKEMLEYEEKNIVKEWKQSHKINGKEITINLHTQCPQDDFFTYEGIIETLQENAISGKIMGWRDDYENGDCEEYISYAE